MPRPGGVAAHRAGTRPILTTTLTLALFIALITLSGCDAKPAAPVGPDGAESAADFLPCPAPSPVSTPATVAGAKLVPDLTLPCMADGGPVNLRRLGQSAVINLWASWCGPCRAELPEFQHLADSAQGKVMVLGVVTNDRRESSSSLAEGLGVTFPTLFDDSAQLQRGAAPSVLPVTLFVDAGGVVRHVDTSGALDLSTLRDLVRQHLGVVLP